MNKSILTYMPPDKSMVKLIILDYPDGFDEPSRKLAEIELRGEALESFVKTINEYHAAQCTPEPIKARNEQITRQRIDFKTNEG